MFLKQYHLGRLAHASSMIAEETTGVAAIIDPQRDVLQDLDDADENGWARNVPLNQFKPIDLIAGSTPDEPFYVICRSGSRLSKACEQFHNSGRRNVVNFVGGTTAWDALA